MNIWFAKNFVPHRADTLLKEFPAIDAWYAKLSAIGHGSVRR